MSLVWEVLLALQGETVFDGTRPHLLADMPYSLCLLTDLVFLPRSDCISVCTVLLAKVYFNKHSPGSTSSRGERSVLLECLMP